jgi:hypothetical protein
MDLLVSKYQGEIFTEKESRELAEISTLSWRQIQRWSKRRPYQLERQQSSKFRGKIVQRLGADFIVSFHRNFTAFSAQKFMENSIRKF